MRRIYLDNAATSWPKAPGLGRIMADYIENDCVNINRTESSKSFEAFSWLFQLREDLCSLYNYQNPQCVIFTKNVTESLNWVIKGLLKTNDKVLVSGYEHNSVMRPLVQLGVDYSIFSEIKQEDFAGKRAVIVNPASNVSGKIQDIEKIAEYAHKEGCLLIIDAAQASPFVELDFEKLHAAVICFTGHKCFMGPQGTGGFIIRKELANTMPALMSGGSGTQSDSLEVPTTLPEKFTCGTENLVGLKGLAYSVHYVLENRQKLMNMARSNTELLYRGLCKINGIRVVGPTLEENRTNVISIVSDIFDIADLAAYLSEHGVETRVGLHCSPLSHKTLGTFPTGTLRFSPGPFNTTDDIEETLTLINQFTSQSC